MLPNSLPSEQPRGGKCARRGRGWLPRRRHFKPETLARYIVESIEANAAVGVVRRPEDYTDSPETLACVAVLLAKRSERRP